MIHTNSFPHEDGAHFQLEGERPSGSTDMVFEEGPLFTDGYSEKDEKGYEGTVIDFLENGFESVEQNAGDLLQRSTTALGHILEKIDAGTPDEAERMRREKVFEPCEEMNETLGRIIRDVSKNRVHALTSVAAIAEQDEDAAASIRNGYKQLFEHYGQTLLAYDEMVNSLELLDGKISS